MKERPASTLPALSPRSARAGLLPGPPGPGTAGLHLGPHAIIKAVTRNRLLRALLLPFLAVIAWQLISTSGIVSNAFLPTPHQALSGFRYWAFEPQNSFSPLQGTWVSDIGLSAMRVAIGYAIGVVSGVSLGVLIGWYPLARDLADPSVQALRPIPMTAWLPFATLVFGISESAAVFLIGMGTFFPIVINTTLGVKQTPEVLVRAALMLGTTRRRVLRRVVLPAALPSILAGLRLGLGIAWVLVIVAEMLSVKGGLGFAIWSAYSFDRMDVIVCGIISLGLCGWISDRILVMLGTRVLRWQKGLVRG